MVLLTIAGLY